MRYRAVLAISSAIVLAMVASPQPTSAVEECPVGGHPTVHNEADLISAYDGVDAHWVLRTQDAPDWAGSGHSNTAVWMGTNGNILLTWVEVGFTQGWKGSDIYTFYAAHKYPNGGGYTYSDHKFTTAPVLGNNVSFTAYKSGSSFVSRFTDFVTGFSQQWSWSGHALPVDKYWVGGEITCPQSPGGASRIDRTYIGYNRVRRTSDGVWVNPSSGTLVEVPLLAGVGKSWCSSPVTFILWVNPQNGTSGCG